MVRRLFQYVSYDSVHMVSGVMVKPLRILHLEDSPADHALACITLRRANGMYEIRHADTMESFMAWLDAERFDLVLADYRLPGFTALDAWRWVSERGDAPPFVLLSGAIGEAAAVDAMRLGMADYLLKDDMARLPHVIGRAIEVHEARRARKQAVRDLAASERRLAELTEHLQISIERERAAIAREIHDDIGGSLTAVRFDVGWIARHSTEEAVRDHAGSATEMLQHAIEASQRIMMNLRPPILDQGLVAAVQWLAESFERRTGIPTRLHSSRDTIEVPGDAPGGLPHGAGGVDQCVEVRPGPAGHHRSLGQRARADAGGDGRWLRHGARHAEQAEVLRAQGPAGTGENGRRVAGHQQPARARHLGHRVDPAGAAGRPGRSRPGRNAMIHVVLCDDHAVLRRGIRDTLTEAPDIQVTGEAGGYSELREILRKAPCDVLLLDLNMPGRSGLEVLSSLKETDSAIKVLVVSMYPEDQYALRCLRAGAQGYANKAGDPMELIEAVRTVMKGRKYLTPEVAQMLADSLAQPASEPAPRGPVRTRATDAGEDRVRQAPFGYCGRAHAEPEDRERVPVACAGKAQAQQQRRTDGVRHPQPGLV